MTSESEKPRYRRNDEEEVGSGGDVENEGDVKGVYRRSE